MPDELPRSLGLTDAVMIGLGAMVGAGIFVALAPAARAAGSALLVSLVIAAIVALCNAISTARLAARHPASGGAYLYGRQRLGQVWGYLAGWGFVVGKTASCAAMALTVGVYAWPAHAHGVAVAAVVLLTAVDYAGIRKSATVNRIIVATVCAVLAAVVTVSASSLVAEPDRILSATHQPAVGVLQAAGLLFFAFAGYARIATLAEEVRDPARVIPRAMMIALAVALALYAVVAVAVLGVLGPDRLAGSAAPLADAVRTARVDWLVPVVGAGAVIAALGSLLALILGLSRTVLAMAREGDLPRMLAAVHPRFAVPHRAGLAAGAVVALVSAVADIRAVIGFSSFAVLVYYGIANASAMTLGAEGGVVWRIVPWIGLAGCAMLAITLPVTAVVTGGAVLVLGLIVLAVRRKG